MPATRKPAKKEVPMPTTNLRTVPSNLPTLTKSGKPLLYTLSLDTLRKMSPDEIRALIAEDEDFGETVWGIGGKFSALGNKCDLNELRELLIEIFKPSGEDIKEEIRRLDDLRCEYPPAEIYDRLQVQIRVLSERMDCSMMSEQYAMGSFESDAVVAWAWTTGDVLDNHSILPPSSDWPSIIKHAKAQKRAAIRKRIRASRTAAQKAA